MTKKQIRAKAAYINNKNFITPAYIQIDNDTIVGISNVVKQTNKDVQDIDLSDTILLPGFTNAHCHLDLTAIGLMQQAHSFVPWLASLIEKKLHLTTNDITTGISQGLKLLRNSGVTTVFDHISCYPLNLEIYSNSDIKKVLFSELLGVNSKKSIDLYTSLCKAKKVSTEPFYITPHSMYAINSETLNLFFSEQVPPFSIHLNESLAEKNLFNNLATDWMKLLKKYDKTWSPCQFGKSSSSIQHIDYLGYSLSNSLIIHGNYIDEKDVEILQEWHNIAVVHCPGSFNFFSHELFPYEVYKDNGIKIALGTDSISSNSTLNMLHEIRLFVKSQPNIGFNELIEMCTINACKAIGLRNTGMIGCGFDADIIGFNACKASNILEVLQTRDHVDFLMVKGSVKL
jgi:aminodeoxyfutalosine deaminase